MLILLPPSETKRSGGTRGPLRLDTLRFPELGGVRGRVIEALVALSDDRDEASRVLKLGATQRDEIAVNAALRSGPVLPAIDRYTGVLYDALDAASLDPASRRWLGRTVVIQSAPFGPIGALDRIPAYRLGAGASIPGLPALRRVWADAAGAAIAEAAGVFVLDLRSEAYVGLGPLPARIASTYVRVVTESAEGTVRALNHFNKHAKGRLVRTLVETRPRVGSTRVLLRWAETAGIHLRPGSSGEIELVV